MWEKLKAVFSSTGAAVVVTFLVRIAILSYLVHLAHHTEAAPVPDGVPFGSETGAIAAAIAEGRGFSSPLRFVRTGATAWLAPIYPYLLAGVFKIFGTYSREANLVIRIIDCAFSAFTVWPIATIGTIAFGKKVGAAAAWLWALLPASIFYSVFWIWDTTLAGLWMALLIAASLKLRGISRIAPWIGYGALWGIAALINPSLLSVLPLLGLWAVWPLPLARAAKLAAASTIVFVVCLAPWTIRNYAVFHKVIPVRSTFGDVLFLGIRADVPDGVRSPLHPNDSLAEAQAYARMGEIAYMEAKEHEALTFIKANPAALAHLVLRRFGETWLDLRDSPYDLGPLASASEKLGLLWNRLFPAMCLLGALFAFRARKDAAAPLALVLLVFPLVFYFSYASLRYRFPIDPLMLVLAVYGIVYPLERCHAFFSATRHPAPTISTATGPDFPPEPGG